MIIHAIQFIGGLVLLLIGGRLLVAASVDTARRLNVPPLIVGLTLVAWGTSAPELALNLVSAFKGRGDLAIGNVVGANISNMAMVLGGCALIKPLVVKERLIRVEIWLNMAVLGFLALVGLALGLERWKSGLLLGVFGGYSVWTIMSAMNQSSRSVPEPSIGDDPTLGKAPMGWWMIAAAFSGGLALLSIGGSLASDAAMAIAIGLGVPAAVVGVTIVSIGTTLPELFTGILAVRKGQTDLAMGNAIGSCLFNAGAIFGLTGIIAPTEIESALAVPLAYMGILAIALVPISRTHKRTVSRVEGAGLLISYAVFLAICAIQAT